MEMLAKYLMRGVVTENNWRIDDGEFLLSIAWRIVKGKRSSFAIFSIPLCVKSQQYAEATEGGGNE
jgi:hypothetical protein